MDRVHYYHAMGTDPAEDKLLFGEKLNKEQEMALELSEDGGWIYYLAIYGRDPKRQKYFYRT